MWQKIWGLIRYSKMLSSIIPKVTVAGVIIGMIASVLEGTCQQVGFEIAFQNSKRKTSLLDCLQILLSLSVQTKFPQRFFHELFKPFLRQKSVFFIQWPVTIGTSSRQYQRDFLTFWVQTVEIIKQIPVYCSIIRTGQFKIQDGGQYSDYSIQFQTALLKKYQQKALERMRCSLSGIQFSRNMRMERFLGIK